MAEAATKAKKKNVAPTEYVVLEREGTAKGTVWRVVGETDTAKAKSALEKKIIVAVVGSREGTFKAVAKRAWKGGVKRAQTTIWKDETIT